MWSLWFPSVLKNVYLITYILFWKKECLHLITLHQLLMLLQLLLPGLCRPAISLSTAVAGARNNEQEGLTRIQSQTVREWTTSEFTKVNTNLGIIDMTCVSTPTPTVHVFLA